MLGTYSKLKIFGVALNQGWHLFKGSAYLKKQYFWNENLLISKMNFFNDEANRLDPVVNGKQKEEVGLVLS